MSEGRIGASRGSKERFMGEEPEVHGLMPHHTGFPGLSRDWEDLDCSAEACANNCFGKCGVPSLAKIGDAGRCEGFKPKGLLKPKGEMREE